MTYNEIHTKSDLPALRDVDQLKYVLWSSIEHIHDLESQLAFFRKHFFGNKSERVTPYDSNQLELDDLLSQLPQSSFDDSQVPKETITYTRKKQQHNGRNSIPDSVPREEITVDPPDSAKVCSCCGKDKEVIAEEVSEQLVRKPATYVVNRYHRRKWACSHCKNDGVVIAPPPPSPIDKCLVDTDFLIWIILSKYCDHLPLRRIQTIIKRESGVTISRSTMVGWIATICFLLEGIVITLHQQLIASGYIHADDTKVRQQNRKQLTYMWLYLSPEEKIAVFDYRVSRNKDGPKEFLKDFKKGILLTDDYPGFNHVVNKQELTHALCWVHARRKFIPIYESGFQEKYCWKAILYINQLFKIERYCKKNASEPKKRLEVRKRLSSIPLGKLERLFKERDFILNKKNKLLNAILYIQDDWDKFTHFMRDGRILIHNNNAELQIRHVAVGRKNWLNTGSTEGGKRMAILYSIIATCKINEVNPKEYLYDILNKIALNIPANEINQLTPIKWKEIHSK